MTTKRVLAIASLGLGIAFIGGLAIKRASFAQPAARAPEPADRLERRVTGTVIESGEVQSASAVELRCRLDEKAEIKWIVEDGVHVKTGDKLVEFDSSLLDHQIAEQKITSHTAQAKLIQAKGQLEAAELQLKTGLDVAEARLKLTTLEDDNFVAKGGEYETRMAAFNNELRVAERKLEVGLELSKRYKSQIEAGISPDATAKLAEAQVTVAAAQAEIDNANAETNLLEKFTRPQQIAALKLAKEEAMAHLLQTRSQSVTAVQLAQAALAAAEEELAIETRRRDRLIEQLKACVIKAPQAGQVVHANRFSSRGGNAEWVAEQGATVHSNQTVIRLPDMSKLELKVRINESKIGRVRPGQPVKIQIDALPRKILTGQVKRVNRYPEPAGWTSGGVKQYGAIITINDPPKAIRLGMNAIAEISVGEEE